MIKYFYTLLFIVAGIFIGCSDSMVDEHFVPSITNQFLYVTPNTLSFSDLGESKNVSVTSLQTPWRFVDYPNWITVSPNSGEGNTTVTITAEKNISADTARTHVFYLESADSKWSYKSYISVSQKKADAYITAIPNSITFDAAGAKKEVEIKSNALWEAKCDATWLNISQTGNGISITVQENITGQTRTATILLYGNGISEQIYIVQQAGGISCSEEELIFEQSGGSQIVKLNAQTSWTVDTSNNWIQATPDNGMAGTSDLNIKVLENTSPSERYGFVYLKVGDKNIIQIKITQRGIYLDTDVASLSFDPQSESKSIVINSNVEWIVTSSQNWIKISDNSGKGNCVLTVNVDENLSTTSRSGTISIESEDNSIKKNISITQFGMSIDTDSQILYFPYTGGSQTLGIMSNTDWTVSSNVAWLNFSLMNGTKEDRLTSVIAAETDSEEERNAAFYLNVSGLQKEIAVRQEGRYFYIDDETMNVSASANTIQLTVSTTESWNASTSDSWISINPTSGNGNATLTITIAENNTSSDRKGTIIFNPADGRQIKVSINQKSKSISVTPQTVIFESHSGLKQQIKVIADGAYTISEDISWLECNSINQNGFIITTTEENLTSSSRKGYITVKLEGTSLSQTITVEQSKQVEEKNYVDLGLPSGTLWAMANLGAKAHEESGIYFQWGCVNGGDEGNPCKTFKSSIQNTEYDAAHVLWGDGWMIPTVAQANELCTYCTSEIVTENGVDCYKMTSRINGKSIYFPISGYYYGTSTTITKTQYSALYWTCEPNLYFSDSYYEAKYLQIPRGVDGTSTGMTKNSRLPIRAVKKR